MSIRPASTAKHSIARHSTAQHGTAQSPLHKAANQVRADQCTYQNKYICTYMHAASGLFSWSMELLAFARRLFVPKILDHLLTTPVCHSNPFFLVSERSGRNRPLREAPCTHYYNLAYNSKQLFIALILNRRTYIYRLLKIIKINSL